MESLFRKMNIVFLQFRKQLRSTMPVFNIDVEIPDPQTRHPTIDFSDSEYYSDVEQKSYNGASDLKRLKVNQ